jgi:hypothetical protein
MTLEKLAMARRWPKIHGYTHSPAAQEAEKRGEMPLTCAVEVVYAGLECKKHKVSRRQVREFLVRHCERGWHHVTGPNRMREVPYYTTSLTDDQKMGLLSQAKKK